MLNNMVDTGYIEDLKEKGKISKPYDIEFWGFGKLKSKISQK